MQQPWKPAGYPSISAYLMCNQITAVVAFLKEAFGATEERRLDTPEGRISHIELRIDDSLVMLSEASAEWPAILTWLHVYVADVDATYRKALAAGGTSAQEPTQKHGDPDRRGGVVDPGGNTWWISTQVG